MGPSGSGKSTLLHILGCLDRPSQGAYLLDGRDVSHATDDELSALRSAVIGFVFQNFHLIPNLTVYDNVRMPFLYRDAAPIAIHEKTLAAVEAVGLVHRLRHHPGQLSGGEMQRTAIARALVNQPRLILADEPTGNLDSATGRAILDILEGLNAAGTTLILVTHDRRIADRAHTLATLSDGRFL